MIEFHNEYPRDYDKRQNEVSRRRYMGSKSEILKFPQFRSIRNLDYNVNNGLREFYFYREVKRILTGLKISISSDMVLKNAEKFYNYFIPHSKCRGVDVLIPVSIYFTCIESFIFVNRDKLLEFGMCTKNAFNRCYMKILMKDDKLRFKLLDINFRQKTILNQLIGLRNHFKLPKAFLKVSIECLFEYYNELKNSKLVVITAKIFRLTKDTLKEEMKNFTIRQACYWLGVHSSVCSNIKLRYKYSEVIKL